MISDSIPKASIAMASSNTKDFAKKKRANRTAKLKQCKLDARREQWLSQVKNKGGSKEEVNGKGGSCGGPEHLENERDMHTNKLEIKPRIGKEIYGDGSSMHHHSDSESSPSNSPTSHTSSVLGSNVSGINFTASSRSNTSSGRSSTCSNGCFSGSVSEEDEGDGGDDGCLDDWEAMADALAATEDNKQEHSPDLGFGLSPSEKHGNSTRGSHSIVANQQFSGVNFSNSKEDSGGIAVQRSPVHCQAWRPDDAFRPRSLPNLSKKYISERHFGRGGSVWGCNNVAPVPTSCPICCEDLDFTDSSFLPCLCGFKLCLFCHKRILEEDGRCPGCRKHYACNFLRGRRQWIEGA